MVLATSQVELDDRSQEQVDNTWKFENNWSWKGVSLSSEMSASAINVSRLFEPFQAEFLSLAPAVAPEDSVSQVSAVSSNPSSSTAVTAPVQGRPPIAEGTPSKFRKVMAAQGSSPGLGKSAPPEGTGLAGASSPK